jgi:hypothetical protein
VLVERLKALGRILPRVIVAVGAGALLIVKSP